MIFIYFFCFVVQQIFVEHDGASRRKSGNWKKESRQKAQPTKAAAAQFTCLVRLLIRLLIRGLYSPGCKNTRELIKMIGMRRQWAANDRMGQGPLQSLFWSEHYCLCMNVRVEGDQCLFCVYLDSWAADCFQCAAVDRAFSFHLPQIGSKASFSWLRKTDMEADGACGEATGRLWRFYQSFSRSRSPLSNCAHISQWCFLLSHNQACLFLREKTS